jgi:hypothetical protein
MVTAVIASVVTAGGTGSPRTGTVAVRLDSAGAEGDDGGERFREVP